MFFSRRDINQNESEELVQIEKGNENEEKSQKFMTAFAIILALTFSARIAT